MTKRISFADLIRGITEQGWALLTPESELQSIDHKSPILVRSPGGYEQRRPAGAFAPGQLPVSCSYDRLLRKGETMWSVIMGAVERGLSNVGNPALTGPSPIQVGRQHSTHCVRSDMAKRRSAKCCSADLQTPPLWDGTWP